MIVILSKRYCFEFHEAFSVITNICYSFQKKKICAIADTKTQHLVTLSLIVAIICQPKNKESREWKQFFKHMIVILSKRYCFEFHEAFSVITNICYCFQKK